MKKIYISFLGTLALTLALSASANAQTTKVQPHYARAEIPTPVLNTANFRSVFGGTDGKTLMRDEQGLIRAIEFIALPGTVFQIENTFAINDTLIYQVNTADYPPQKSGLYIDSRFVSVSAVPLKPHTKTRPSQKIILDRMVANQGLRYVWGGNISRGIPEMFQFYPPSQRIAPESENMWALHGLDCSGLLYEATHGTTPRNTSDLINYGMPVSIEGLSPGKIAKKLLPLDLIVWKGHVIIVLNQTQTIESCMGCSPTGGVTIRNLQTVLEEVMSTRKAVNVYPSKTSPNEKPFVVRRWA